MNFVEHNRTDRRRRHGRTNCRHRVAFAGDDIAGGIEANDAEIVASILQRHGRDPVGNACPADRPRRAVDGERGGVNGRGALQNSQTVADGHG